MGVFHPESIFQGFSCYYLYNNRSHGLIHVYVRPLSFLVTNCITFPISVRFRTSASPDQDSTSRRQALRMKFWFEIIILFISLLNVQKKICTRKINQCYLVSCKHCKQYIFVTGNKYLSLIYIMMYGYGY